jgi:hypothetical protein
MVLRELAPTAADTLVQARPSHLTPWPETSATPGTRRSAQAGLHSP